MEIKRKKIDVLWLVEHIARELDVACIAKSIAEDRYGYRIDIRNFYDHAIDSMETYDPLVVVHPYFYFCDGALATEDYVKSWPEAIHFNLAWEQIHYKAHLKIKSPSDNFARNKVIHHAWGTFYNDYLLQHGVPLDHIFINGQPAYQLYKHPYRHFFKTRTDLAEIYGLDPARRWVFIPENYRWAFIGDKIKLFTDLGAEKEEILALKEFCTLSLQKLLKWCNKIADDDDLCIIFRPRPAVNSTVMQEFFREHVGKPAPGLSFIKNESVREWILASDLVISSYSTTLIEASIAGKPAYMMEPIEFPESLFCEWYEHAPRIHNEKGFRDICTGEKSIDEKKTLQAWAENEMLAFGDPIENLASYINMLVAKQRMRPMGRSDSHSAPVMTQKNYFNRSTHENDIFDGDYVNALTDKWSSLLSEHQKAYKSDRHAQKASTDDAIINKTMSYSDLLTREAAPTVKALNKLILDLYRKGIWMSSWVGTLPEQPIKTSNLFSRFKRTIGLNRAWGTAALEDPKEGRALKRGIEQRLDYTPLPDAADDVRFPWFLYWEIFWIIKVTAPYIDSKARIFDGGGSASLFTSYMASLGYEIHSVELNDKLNRHCRQIAKAMNWNLTSYNMDLRRMDFPDEYFDHAYSVCVFEHLDYDIKQSALAEIARCLKPGGIFSITFDYRNPAPGVVGYGKDTRPRNQLKTKEDIKRSFLSSGHFELMGNPDFVDTNESNLVHQRFGYTPYTFGAIFMRKK